MLYDTLLLTKQYQHLYSEGHFCVFIEHKELGNYKSSKPEQMQCLSRSQHICEKPFQTLFDLALFRIHTGSSLSTSSGLETTWMSSISKS